MATRRAKNYIHRTSQSKVMDQNKILRLKKSFLRWFCIYYHITEISTKVQVFNDSQILRFCDLKKTNVQYPQQSIYFLDEELKTFQMTCQPCSNSF